MTACRTTLAMLLAALLTACMQDPEAGGPPLVQITDAGVLQALDGNTLVLREGGDRIYFSRDLRNFLRAAEGKDAFRRMLGREVTGEGGFLAATRSLPSRDTVAGVAAVTSQDARVVSLALVQTFEGDDRILDLHARERLMMALTVTGTHTHVACMSTGWKNSDHRFVPADFQPRRCEIRAGRSLDGLTN